MLDVTEMLRPERAALLELLESLRPEDWKRSTECPAYTVQGVATHLLGDDLSLLSRQRDAAMNGLLLTAVDLPGADFKTLLDTFNDTWVSTARFLSPAVAIELLRAVGETTAVFYETVDLMAPCEPVFFFGSKGEVSPYWQAIAREFIERWVHHSQIRRAVGMRSLAEEPFVRTGAAVLAAAARVESQFDDNTWSIGPVAFGDPQQAADIFTRAHTAEEIRGLVTGPSDAVERAATMCAR